MKRGKVQTNDYGVNVLVEHEDCNGRHISSWGFEVRCEKMTDEEINSEFDKITIGIEDKKSFLRKIKGFATSNVYSKENNILYNDLFRYKNQELKI